MKSDQKRRAIQIVSALQTRGATVSVEPIVTLLRELIEAPEQPASVPDWLETTRFLTDVTTAAGLLEHGRRDKGLAQRIGDFAHKYRMLAAAPERDPELVRDAARYRWLQWSNWYVGPDSFYCTEGGDLAEYNDKNVSAENLNAEIDAARAAEKGGRVMGEVAEMMLDGTLCAGCGVYLHGDGEGFPRYCEDCCDPVMPIMPRPKVSCPICKKRVKAAGIEDHKRDAHGMKGQA